MRWWILLLLDAVFNLELPSQVCVRISRHSLHSWPQLLPEVHAPCIKGGEVRKPKMDLGTSVTTTGKSTLATGCKGQVLRKGFLWTHKEFFAIVTIAKWPREVRRKRVRLPSWKSYFVLLHRDALTPSEVPRILRIINLDPVHFWFDLLKMIMLLCHRKKPSRAYIFWWICYLPFKLLC